MGNGGICANRRIGKYGIAYSSKLTKDGNTSKWFIDVSGEAQPIELASTTAQRLRGMLFRDPDEITRLLVPCHDVHTFGMRHPLDIAFITKDGGVLEVYRKVGVRKRLKNKRASMVAERFSRDDDWLRVGDVIKLGTPHSDNAYLRKDRNEAMPSM